MPGIRDLSELWCLEFVILSTKLRGKAVYLRPDPKDRVLRGKQISGRQLKQTEHSDIRKSSIINPKEKDNLK